jgi:F-type H+-transporting ATPase subunit b
MPKFLNPAEAEFWVGAGLLIFLAIVLWKGRGAITGALDAKAKQIQSDLDEAARLRTEAERLLTELRAERAEAERRAAEMLAEAEAEARRVEEEGRRKTEEQVARRAAAADRRIALAEAQAAQDVKAAAAALAAELAGTVLARRVAEGAADPLIDRGIAQIGGRIQ